MAKANIKVTFPHSIENVWNVVTDLTNYDWRSDLSRIEIIDEKHFVEYTKKGYATTFTITVVAKKVFMKLFVKAFLKKQQALYIADLRKAL